MDPRTLAEAVRTACVQAALEAYTQGGFSGLCAEGRFELAVGAMRTLELEPLLGIVSGTGAGAGQEPADAGTQAPAAPPTPAR